ncbi:MAG: SWIB/MDM2 domain-containing protein [Betaproteobacteria bacterium]|nr:SWIB/MDM2 domain-containing protein [Betaproteobacteria bacterium]
MAAKKTKIKIKPIFLSHEKLAKVYQLTKKDKKILNPLERKASAAFEKPMTPDVALASVVGSNAMPRVEVTKKIWAYIKKNKLQDTTNKRMINAGDKLKDVFGGKKQVSMFEITRLVN